MKNSPLSALVLFGIAGLVGGVTYLASGDDRIEANPEVVSRPVVKTPTVMTVTPHERKLQRRHEEAVQLLEHYKKTGKTLESGAIKTVDGTGTPLYVHPELIEGKGRYGEPLFMMATYKRKAAVPLLKNRKAPKSENIGKLRRLPQGQTPLTMGGKRPSTSQSLNGPGDGEDSQGGGKSKGGGKGPGKPGEADQPTDG